MQRVPSSTAILSIATDLSAMETVASTPPSNAVPCIQSGAGAQPPMDTLFLIHFRGICLMAIAVSAIDKQ